MHTPQHKTILISPLDWGLGHTTRCVPIIKQLRSRGCEVMAAGNEWQLEYLTKTFPKLATLPLEGYNMHYSRHGSSFMISILSQVPKLLSAVRKEHQWLTVQAGKYHFDGIISDNRYGLWHSKIPSVIMTHQVLAKSGMGPMPDRVLRQLHYQHLQKFGACWIVDVAGEPNLSGSLGHPGVLPANGKYIGLLSQLEQGALQEEKHLLILLSGPEPQRTILSGMLWEQVQNHKGAVVFIEGSNKVQEPSSIAPHIQYNKQVTKDVLQPLLAQASMVICRSGYSSLMDLVALGKKAILVPTPGQTEQEYLGKHLDKEGVFLHAPQKGFNLEQVLASAVDFPFRSLAMTGAHHQYETTLDNWAASL